MKKLAAFLLPFVMVTPAALGYGEEGHQAVGAVADGVLQGKPAAAKVRALLDGMTLQQAATLPDEIKNWDRNKPFRLAGHPQIESDLRDFWAANLATAPNGEKLHHVFHYTDVSIATEHPAYKDGAIGTSAYDVVHMIPYCIKVLTDRLPEDNDRKITRPVAVILLAHYLGDIHQPLHVGAAYFDDNNQLVTPKKAIPYREDTGGNDITLHFGKKSAGSLHHYWDTTAVLRAFKIKPKQFDPAVVQDLIASKPADWQPAEGTKPADWAETWADEILPTAREAHTRLQFAEPGNDEGKINATVHDAQGQVPYDQWAAETVKDEIHKAGWRLAYLLEQIVH